jgi:DNA-binding NarL/FixJ family response regulator
MHSGAVTVCQRVTASRTRSGGDLEKRGESKHIRVVVADDDPTILRLVETALPMAAPDIEIVATAQSVEALAETVLEHQPDVVIVDRYFNSLDGIEIAARLRSQSPKSALLLWTGTATDELHREAKEAGFHGVMEKSSDIEALATLLRKMAGRDAVA